MLLFLLFPSLALCFFPTDVVETSLGPVVGLRDGPLEAFLGVPYGEIPARFEPSEYAEQWAEPLPVVDLPPPCAQHCHLPPLLCPQMNYSIEDCLYLNIFRPTETEYYDDDLPVAVFLYGGAYESGTIDTCMYMGSRFVSQNIILVTVAYRLGALGFLSGVGGLQGNAGIGDQRLALRWVQANARAFGGDPDRVTLFGESAGAMSTAVHLTSEASKGLFSAAIVESDPAGLLAPLASEEGPLITSFVDKVGCNGAPDVLACLQEAPVDDVVSAGFSASTPLRPWDLSTRLVLPFRPVINHIDLDRRPLDAFRDGTAWGLSIRIMMGTNSDEGLWFTRSATDYMQTEELLAAVAAFWGPTVAYKLSDYYKLSLNPLTNVVDTLAAIVTDYLFACPTRLMARSMPKGQGYLYHFAQIAPNLAASVYGINMSYCFNATCHGSELLSVFNTGDICGLDLTPAQRRTGDLINGVWGDFMRGQSPPSWWPSADSGKNVRFGNNGTHAVESYLDDVCTKLWDPTDYAV
jgi:para-nitrobenzyl esterase